MNVDSGLCCSKLMRPLLMSVENVRVQTLIVTMFVILRRWKLALL